MGEVALYDISKRFTLRIDGAVHTVQALSRVSFKVHDGEIVALIGPSGCGKTTVLRIAMGLETASGGKVAVDGREVRGCGHDRGQREPLRYIVEGDLTHAADHLSMWRRGSE